MLQEEVKLTLKGEANNASRVTLTVDKNVKQFEGLQPEKESRPKAAHPPAPDPKPGWRPFIPVGIVILSLSILIFAWTKAKFCGNDYISMGDLQQAIKTYELDAASQGSTGKPKINNHLALANIYLKDKSFAQASKVLESGLAIVTDEHDLKELHYAKGNVFSHQQQWHDALSEYNLSEPPRAKATDNYTVIELRRKLHQRKLIAYTHLHDQAGIDAELKALWPKEIQSNQIAFLGRLLLLAGRTEEAKSFVLRENGKRLSAKETSSYEQRQISELLGDIYLIEKNYPQALRYYNEADMDMARCALLDKASRVYKALGNEQQYKATAKRVQQKHHTEWTRKLREKENKHQTNLWSYVHENHTALIRHELGIRYPDLNHPSDCDD